MEVQTVSSARGAPVDRGEYGPMAADETHIADEVERGRLIEALDGRCDEIGDYCKADLVSLVLQKKGRREGEWARREQTRWLGDCERTWILVLKVVVPREGRGHKTLCSPLVHLEEDESLRYGILMTEALPFERLTMWQEFSHFDSRLGLAGRVIVDDRVRLRAVER